MNRRRISVIVALTAILFAGVFYLGRRTAGQPIDTAAAPPAAAALAERKVLYWQDPMSPGQRFDKPGKSPFMDMQLEPVYADESGDSSVKVSPGMQQNLGIRTATVRRAELSSSFEAVGSVQFDERLNSVVQTRVSGYLEHLAVRATMERVTRGEVLATVFAPDWLGPLNDIVALQRAGAPPELRTAAQMRARTLSIPSDLVRQAEQGGTPSARFTLVSPASGVVAELGAREGAAVSPGMTLFRIAGLDRVWAVAEVPEVQAVHLMRGQRVRATLQADPSQSFTGVLQEILPQVNPATRTLQARFEVDNRGGRLTPGMLLRLQVSGPKVSRLIVPAEAVIRTGNRAVAIVRNDQGNFEPRELTLGADLGDTIEVIAGLAEGEQVVASGQFLLDSEARLRPVLGQMASTASASTPPAPSMGASK